MKTNQSESSQLVDRNSIDMLKREQCQNLKINVNSTATDSFGSKHLRVGCPSFKTRSFTKTGGPKILTLLSKPNRGRDLDKMSSLANFYETLEDNDDDYWAETTASTSLSYAVSSDLEQNAPTLESSFTTTGGPKILTLLPKPNRGRDLDKMPSLATFYETVQDNDDDHWTETTASTSLSYAVSSDLEQNAPNLESSFSTYSDSSESNEATLNHYPSIECYNKSSRSERGKSGNSSKTTALLHALGDSIKVIPKLRTEYLYNYGVESIKLKREVEFIQKCLNAKKEIVFQMNWKKKQQMELKKNRVTRKEITQRLYDRCFESRMEGTRRREEIANKLKLRKEARENDFCIT